MVQSKRLGVTTLRNDKNRRRFKCHTCDKTFKRSEHCARHELMHTQERPYTCQYCGKSYGRKDLVRRHERTLHADQWAEDMAGDNAHSSPSNQTEQSEIEYVDQDEHAPMQNPGMDTPHGSDRQYSRDPDLGHLLPVSLPTNHEGGTNNIADCSLGPDLNQIHAQDIGLDSAGLEIPLLQLLETTSPERSAEYMVEEAIPSGIDRILSNYGSTSMSIDRAPHATITDAPRHAGGDLFDNHDIWALNLGFDIDGSPVDAWSKNPDTLTLNLPRIQQEKQIPSFKVTMNEESFEQIHSDVLMRLDHSSSRSSQFTSSELQQFLNSYIEGFHPHMPIIHLPSFSLPNTACPLILAMASIGALYRLRRRKAYQLYDLADKLISSDSYHLSDSPHRSALWLMQTRILLALFATLSNNERLASDRFKKLGFFMLEYQWRRMEVQDAVSNKNNMTWDEWIQFEQTKRALCAMFIFSDLMLITFNLTPGFVIDRDLLIETPDDEELWNAQTVEEWERAQNVRTNSAPCHTIQSAMERMIQVPTTDHGNIETYQMSGFTALTIMHAVNVYLWHLNQFAASIGRFSLEMWPHDNLRTALLHAATSALERCQAALLDGRSEECKFAWDDPANVMIFNCGAVLRSAYSRLLPPTHSFNRLSLLTDDQEVIREAVRTYASARLDRTVFVTKAAQKAYEGFLAPVTIGHLFVSKTAALHWSVEQAVVGWDSALLLTKWLHNLEIEGSSSPPNDEEQHIVNNLRRLLSEMEVEHEDGPPRSLAAILARSWATFLDDVWVWGITPRMGAILKLLAVQYEQRYNAAHPREGWGT